MTRKSQAHPPHVIAAKSYRLLPGAKNTSRAGTKWTKGWSDVEKYNGHPDGIAKAKRESANRGARVTKRYLHKLERDGQLMFDTSHRVLKSNGAPLNSRREESGRRAFAERIQEFLKRIERHGFTAKAERGKGETLRVKKDGIDYGYVNDSVEHRRDENSEKGNGVLGYRFAFGSFATGTDACPDDFDARHFCRRYQCKRPAFFIHRGSKGRTHLIVRDPDVAERVLLKEAGIKRNQQTASPRRESRRSPRNFAEIAAVEGVLTEVRRFARARNRTLRDIKFTKSEGKCEACRTDFSKVLGGKGTRVLLVHHDQKQLANYRHGGEVTSEADLAVVCANCHMLLHLNPRQAMSVRTLRRRLKKDNPTTAISF